MKPKKLLELEDGEEVIYLTKAMIEDIGPLFCFAIILTMLALGLSIDPSASEILSIFYIISLIPMTCGGIMLWDQFKREYRTLYYITTKRIIQIIGDGLFPHKPKQYEINLDDIAYFEEYDGLWIVQKGTNGELHYTTEVVEKVEDLPKNVKTIQFKMNGKEAQKVKKVIIKKLTDILPAIQHPNLEDIYLTTR